MSKLKLLLEKRNLNKIKNIISAVAIVVAIAVVSPGILTLATVQGDVITDADIAAYNSNKYEEEVYIADNSYGSSVFSGFENIPEVTPDPQNADEEEKKSLADRIKEIMKERDALAPNSPGAPLKSNKNQVTGFDTFKDTGDKKDEDKEKDEDAEPTPEPTAPPTPTPEIPATELFHGATTPPVDSEHSADLGGKSYNIYDLQILPANNVLAVVATPRRYVEETITSVKMELLHNGNVVATRTASNPDNIFEVFDFNKYEDSYYEVILYITIETDEATEGRNATITVLRQASGAVHIVAEPMPTPTPEPTPAPSETEAPSEEVTEVQIQEETPIE